MSPVSLVDVIAAVVRVPLDGLLRNELVQNNKTDTINCIES